MATYIGDQMVSVGIYVTTDRVVLSKAEYEALEVKDPNIMYMVYDDPTLEEIESHIDDTDIHVTAEEKERWNTPVRSDSPLPLYLALVGSINDEMVNASLGKNNEENIHCVGSALVMYAQYKGTTSEFVVLPKCDTVNDIINSKDARIEFLNDTNLCAFVKNSNIYLSDMVTKHITNGEVSGVGSASDWSTTKKSYNITITDDMINNCVTFIEFNSYAGGGSVNENVNYASVKLNDVLMHKNIQARVTETFSEIIKWSDYGITQAGTYTLLLEVISSTTTTNSSISNLNILTW